MPFLPRNFRAIIKNDINARGEETISETITIDASLSEDHVYRNTPTRLTIEDGSKITDHISIEPNRLEMTVLFTDTPISNYDITEQFGTFEGRAKQFFQKLKAIRDQKKIVTIITGLIPHQSMALSELGVPRRSGDGKKVECRCIFDQIPRATREGTLVQREEVQLSTDVNHTAIPLIALGAITVGTGIGAILDDIF